MEIYVIDNVVIIVTYLWMKDRELHYNMKFKYNNYILKDKKLA
jgi:hypothetical protein